MQFVIIIVLALIFFYFKNESDKRKNQRKLRAKLINQWGDVPTQEYTTEKLKSITAYYRKIKKHEHEIDDTTWNDLDMDQIYMTMNNTCSSIGEEYLYALLRQLQFDQEELKKRNELMEFFQNNPEKRLRIQELFSIMGKVKRVSIYEYMSRLNVIPTENNWIHYLMILSVFAGIGVMFVSLPIGALITVACIVHNIVRYYLRKSQVESYYDVVSYIIRLLDCVKEFNRLTFSEITEFQQELKEVERIFASFRRGARIVASKKPTGDMMEMFMEYPRMVFHMDLIKFNQMIRTFEKHHKELMSVYDTIGFLDSMLATASFRALLDGEYCIPELKKKQKAFLYAENLYHPMITAPVKNSVYVDQSALITGSNASGKSTFIKTLAINAILAQTIYTAVCKSYKASYFQIASSMALQDNLKQKESYYIVEIKSLKRILHMMDDEIPTLCFVDEVLRGTNTLERIAASSQILKYLSEKNCICFAATHDLELTHILESFYKNYHFQEQIIENNIEFDYVLHDGRAVSRNAIRLLSILGYEESMIQAATEEANHFLETGEWKVV